MAKSERIGMDDAAAVAVVLAVLSDDTTDSRRSPRIWSQYGQGAAGTVYVSPIPDANYTLSIDSACYPSTLTADTDVEVIPYLWTDAIAYYAAYLGLMAMQTGGNTQESDRMYKRYQEYVARARMAANPSILPSNYQQSPPMPSNQLARCLRREASDVVPIPTGDPAPH